MDKMGFDMNLIMMSQKGSIQTFYTFENKLWVLKQYILMDYWNTVSSDIISGVWDFRDELQVGTNIIDGYNLLFNKLTTNFSKKTESILDKEKENYEKVKSGQTVTVPSGIPAVDVVTNGWFNGELIITAARPGMGKTTLALIMAIRAAFHYNKKVYFCSLEMPKVQLFNKIAAYQLKLDYQKIKTYSYEPEIMEQVFNFYKILESPTSNLVITDKKEVRTVSQLDKKVQEINPDILFVDYLQLLKIEGNVKVKPGNREQEISYISSSLKDIALVSDIPVIALSQLSRAVESRDNKRPQLSDLRESGSIEQDADIVIFYYRDAYYKELKKIPYPDFEKWNLEFTFAKYRDGASKTVYLNANYLTYEVTEGFATGPELPPQ